VPGLTAKRDIASAYIKKEFVSVKWIGDDVRNIQTETKLDIDKITSPGRQQLIFDLRVLSAPNLDSALSGNVFGIKFPFVKVLNKVLPELVYNRR
jgi:hypothetical protein